MGLSGLEGRDLDDVLVALEGMNLQDHLVAPVYDEKPGMESVSFDLLHRPPIAVHNRGFPWFSLPRRLTGNDQELPRLGHCRSGNQNDYQQNESCHSNLFNHNLFPPSLDRFFLAVVRISGMSISRKGLFHRTTPACFCLLHQLYGYPV